MLKEFAYTVKLVVQHKTLGTLDFIVKNFKASINVNQNDYYVSFPLNSDNILTEMNSEINAFITSKSYNKDDIDFISYEVSTDEPYVDVFFASDNSNVVRTINPQIEATIIPEVFKPTTPQGFNAIIVNNVIEWSWSGIENCAYRIYDENNKVIASIGIDTLVFLETNLKPGQNYSRKISAYNLNGESDTSPYVTVTAAKIADSISSNIDIKDNTLKNTKAKEIDPIEENIEQLDNFKSGIGDGLDLFITPIDELRIHEKFNFDIMLEGYILRKQIMYTAIPFTYKVVAVGELSGTKWTKESAILSGIVNGKEPLKNDGDGKRDLITVAPIIDIDLGVTDVVFNIQLIDTGGKTIDVKCKNELYSAQTPVNGDIITFSSTQVQAVNVYDKWTGPIVTSKDFEISTSNIIISSTVYNPLYDYSMKNASLSDVKIKAISNNPNVTVIPVIKNVIDFASILYKDKFEIPFDFQANIISPSQSAWSPTINPGYYYIMNDEFFLYANSAPKGDKTILAMPRIKPFYAAIKTIITTPSSTTNIVINKSILCKVPMDGLIHEISTCSVKDIIKPSILALGISNYTILNISISVVDPYVEVYHDYLGQLYLYATCFDELYDNIESEYIRIDNTNKNGMLSPLPQIGRPIVAVHKDRGALKHITFLDDKGNITLSNTEIFEYSGLNVIKLSYTGIDIDTLNITADGTPVVIKKVINNHIYLDDNFVTEIDTEITVKYELLNSFIVDYNTGEIKVHLHSKATDQDYKYIRVFYDTEEYEEYYATELELNPLYNITNSGFIYLTDYDNELKHIEIKINPDTFSVNNLSTSYIFIKATDEIGNPVSNVTINLSAVHGTIDITSNVTNKFGIITAKYYAPSISCQDTITAIDSTGNISVNKKLSIIETASTVYITANSVGDIYLIKEGTDINIESKAFLEDLTPMVARDMTLFIKSVYGTAPDISITDITNIDGKCFFTVKPIVNSPNDISRIEISCLDAKEYIDIKVVK